MTNLAIGHPVRALELCCSTTEPEALQDRAPVSKPRATGLFIECKLTIRA